MSELSGPERAAASGQADSLVVFLHGYGADGNDLIGLAEPLGQHLPNTRFVAPDAPQRSVNNPMGYLWFPIPWLDGSDPVAAMRDAASAFDTLNRYFDGLAEAGMPPDRTVVVGFSQGTMKALHVLPPRPVPMAGIVGFSARLLEPATVDDESVSRPPVLLVHGEDDPMVPPSSMPEAAEALTNAGVETYTHLSKGIGHGIGPDGLGLALQFIRRQLGLEE